MEIRRYYAKRFSVERMSQCTQPQWAVAAAEVQAMVQSKEIFLRARGTIQEDIMSKTKQKFVAQWGVQTKARVGAVETLYKQEKRFESPSITAAKAQATRLLKADNKVTDLLKSEWYPEWFNLRLKPWEPETVSHQDPTIIYCYRRSDTEYKSQDKDEPSLEQWAFLYLYWRKDAENADEH